MIAALSALTLLSEAATTEEMMQSLSQNMGSIVMSTLLLLVPCIAITGPCTAGVCYVTRNWARDEHAFIWSDFKDAVKENWKQGLAISVITGLLPLVVYVCWNFYSAMGSGKSCDGGSSGAHCHGRLHLGIGPLRIFTR